MKKILFLLACFLFTTVSCFAENKIYCELENQNAVTYFTNSLKFPINKTFFKYVDNNGNSQYWIKISYNSAKEVNHRFLYYLNVKVDDQEFTLPEIQEINFTQLKAGSSQPNIHDIRAFAFYRTTPELIKKLSSSKNPVIFKVHHQTKQNIVSNTDIEFTQAAQKIISLTYNDKDKYWQPNVKE